MLRSVDRLLARLPPNLLLALCLLLVGLCQIKTAGKHALLVEKVPSADPPTVTETPVGSSDGAPNPQEDA